MKQSLSLIALLASIVLLISCGAGKHNKKQRQLNQTYKSLKKELPEAQVTMVHDTIKIMFPESVLFPTGSAEINESFMPKMEVFAKVLNKYEKTSILINGYTDNTGTPQLNQSLSNNRAINSKKTLNKYNVPNSRMYHWGRGESNPIASNDTPEGRKKNRRVEFIVLYDYEPK